MDHNIMFSENKSQKEANKGKEEGAKNRTLRHSACERFYMGSGYKQKKLLPAS